MRTVTNGMGDRTLEPDAMALGARPAPAPATTPTLAPSSCDVVVRRTREDGQRVVHKIATGRARARLRREAELLEHLSLPERVELIAVLDLEDALDDPGGAASTVMVSVDAGPTTLADTSDVRDEDVLRALRRSTDALVRLHASGWCHGAVVPEHIVVGARGRVRLCSFGDARPVDPDDPTATAGDVRGLLRVVEHVARRPSSSRSWRQRRRWRRSARTLGRIAARARTADDPPTVTLHDVGLALSEPQPGDPSRGRRLARIVVPLVLAGAGGLALAGALGVARSAPTGPPTWRSRGTERAAPFAPFATVTLDRGAVVDDPADAQVAGHVVSIDGRDYRLGVPGDLAAVGDWDCDGNPTARLVRPGTGEVFEFRTWAAPGAPAQGTLIATVRTALPLREVRSSPAAEGPSGSCDRLLVAPMDGELFELVVEDEEAHP